MDSYNLKINLSKLKGAFVKVIPGKTTSKKCLCIPIDDAGLFVGKKGLYLSMAAWPIKEPKFRETHMVKQAILKEKYNQMTDEQKAEIPVLGGLEPFLRENSSASVEEDDLPY